MWLSVESRQQSPEAIANERLDLVDEAVSGSATKRTSSSPSPRASNACSPTPDGQALAECYRTVRRCTEALCGPLAAEDYAPIHAGCEPGEVASGPHDVVFRNIPAFAISARLQPFHPLFRFLFNSYYQSVGPAGRDRNVGCCPAPRRWKFSAIAPTSIITWTSFSKRLVLRPSSKLRRRYCWESTTNSNTKS